MGGCGSAKKNISHSHSISHSHKNNINERKVSASTVNIPNGGSNAYVEGYTKRKSVKLNEFDRISKETILDGK